MLSLTPVSVTNPIVIERVAVNRAEKIKQVFRVSVGNFLEMYDFMVFGY